MKKVRSDLIDLTGKRFGKYTVLEYVGKYRWRCRCDCGNEKDILGQSLRRGESNQCNECRLKEFRVGLGKKHGLTSRGNIPHEYAIWTNMRDRCNNPNNPAYKDYGGRGIEVCERWNDCATFIEDMGPRPSRKHSIDRIDNDSGYSPDNCRWATKKQQQRNMRTTAMLEYEGQLVPRIELAERFGIPENTLRGRLNAGMPLEVALTMPRRNRENRDTESGRYMTMNEMRTEWEKSHSVD